MWLCAFVILWYEIISVCIALDTKVCSHIIFFPLFLSMSHLFSLPSVFSPLLSSIKIEEGNLFFISGQTII